MSDINLIRKRINEGKDVSIYKKLLHILTQWSEKFPMTGVDTLLDKVINQGKAILPKDKKALNIIDHTISKESFSASVSDLLNTRFSDLPSEMKPFAKINRKMQLAFWNTGTRVTDMVKDLIDLEKKKTKGFWCDLNGNKVELIDIDESGE
jgi:hypothetical protein